MTAQVGSGIFFIRHFLERTLVDPSIHLELQFYFYFAFYKPLNDCNSFRFESPPIPTPLPSPVSQIFSKRSGSRKLFKINPMLWKSQYTLISFPNNEDSRMLSLSKLNHQKPSMDDIVRTVLTCKTPCDLSNLNRI